MRAGDALRVHVQEAKGTPADRLRLALVYLLTCEALPSDADYQRITTALAVRSPPCS